MEKGTNFTIDYLKRYIGKEKLQELENYLEDLKTQDFYAFNDGAEVHEVLDDVSFGFLAKLDEAEINKIYNYTGLSFRCVNALLRNSWNYDTNGLLTEDLKREYSNYARDLTEIMAKTLEVGRNFRVYRGVNINAFNSYGITRIEDLEYLEGKYFYDEGFMSTSLIRSMSFFEHKPEWGDNPNVLMEIMVPKISDDGIFLNNSLLSSSTNQLEFLIKSGSLFKITEVYFDNNKKTGYLKMVLIPEKIWNLADYEALRKDIILK